MIKMLVTFSEITPESAEFGDFSDHGIEDETEFDTVAEFVDHMKREGAHEVSSSQFHRGIWYSTGYYTSCYRTSTERNQSFHPKDCDEATERAIYELFQTETKRHG